MGAVAVSLNEKIKSRRSVKAMNGHTDIGKLSEALREAHGSLLDLKLATYWDSSWGLMLFGYSPKDIARMSRSGVKESDIAGLKLPDIVIEYILGKSWRKPDIPAYYKALHAWGRKYRARNRISGSNLYDFNAARAQRIREGAGQ